MTKPSVGRIVHYVSYGTPGGEYRSKCRAAIITEVGQWVTVKAVEEIPGEQRTVHQVWEPDACALLVANPTGAFFNGAGEVACQYDEGGTGVDHSGAEIAERSYRGGTWHWPERTDDG